MRKVLYILGQLMDEDIDTLLALGKRRGVPAKTVLVTEGRPIDSLFILLEGELSVTSREVGGQEMNRLRSGEVIGELSFLDSRPPSASVWATVDSMVFAIDRTALARELVRDTGFASRFYKALGQFLAHRLRRIVLHLGFGGPAKGRAPESRDDELDDTFLDQVDLAAARFDRILARLRGSPLASRGE